MRLARLATIASLLLSVLAATALAATPRQAAGIIKPKVEQHLKREGQYMPRVGLRERLGGKPGQNTRPFTVHQTALRRVGASFITVGTVTPGKIDLRREKVTIGRTVNVK